MTEGGQAAGKPVGGVSEQQGESGRLPGAWLAAQMLQAPQQGLGPGPRGGEALEESSVGLAGAFCFVSLPSSHNSVSGK